MLEDILAVCSVTENPSFSLFHSILMFGLPALANYTKSGFFAFYTAQVFPYITPVVYPIGLIAQSSSVYLTLLVTIERYVAVCSPLRARYESFRQTFDVKLKF